MRQFLLSVLGFSIPLRKIINLHFMEPGRFRDS